MKSILIIDDEKEICESIKMILEYEDYYVEYSTDVQSGLEKLKFSNYDALLLDIQMPEMTGFEVLKWLEEEKIDVPVIVISAHSSLENAVKATKLGAFDFLEKPIDRDKLLISIRNAVGHSNLKKENLSLKENLEIERKIIGKSKVIQNILASVDRIATTEARVIITGENGTGKELIAREIHKKSNRAKFPLIEVNCAAIPNELIESELFGHEKGAFTGAMQQRIGKFEQADKGTLFLDEIGDMSLQAQAKVLRAIEEGIIQRVGGTKQISVDVRIISATNKDLEKEIAEGNFREDLYHRLNVIPLHVPPLRERREDIPILVEHFLDLFSKKNNYPRKTFTKEAMDILINLPWKGNVRELRNIIERIVIMVPEDNISAEAIRPLIGVQHSDESSLINISNSFQEFKEKAERAYIIKQLEANDWNISKTAEIMEIQRSHLYSKMKKYNITREV